MSLRKSKSTDYKHQDKKDLYISHTNTSFNFINSEDKNKDNQNKIIKV